MSSTSTPKAAPIESGDPSTDDSPSTNVPRRRRRRRSSRFHRLRRRLGIERIHWMRFFAIFIAIIAVLGVGTVALIVDSANQVQNSITRFQRVADSLSNRPGTELTLEDFNRLDTTIRELVGSLASTESRLGFLRPLSSFSTTLETAFTGIQAGHELALAARDMMNGLQPTLFFLVSGSDTQAVASQISSGERVVELLRIGRGQFVSAQTHLDNAKKQIDSMSFDNIDASLFLSLRTLIRYQDQLTQMNQILMTAPEVLNSALGISGERNYLVLSANNDELRPSGGYISTYGWITIRNGRVTNYNYSATTDTSPNPPPQSMSSQVQIPDWWLRLQQPIYAAWDSSWYADFPSTARMSIWYYNSGANPQSPVDGVISIDITGFEYLLKVLGRVTVPGYNVTVTPDNFRSIVYSYRQEGDKEHKRFLAALYQQIFSDWQSSSLDASKNSALLGMLLQGLQEKHIMMYFVNDELNRAVNLLGWTGAQATPTDFDYLMIADTNLGNKSNHSVIRQLTYDVDLQKDGSVIGRATVAYDYSAQTAASDPAVNPQFNGPIDYNNLFQLFVPPGTTLTNATNLQTTPTAVNTDTMTEFVGRIYLPFDNSERYQFSYQTRPLVEDYGPYKRYRLLVQKQPGTPANAVNVQVMLPTGARIITVSPSPNARYTLDRPILEFRSDLSVDRWIEVIYSP